jgi:hypothetical protein
MSVPVTTSGAGLQLHIERIVVDGVPLSGAQARQLRGAVEAELARLFDGGVHAWRSAAVQRLAAPVVPLTTPVRPLELGRAIARSVHASLTRIP